MLLFHKYSNAPVSVTMSCQKVETKVSCSFEYVNNAQKDLYLMKRDSPLEGEILSPYISVYFSGERLEYEGVFVHRDEPTIDDFVLLRAGETHATSIKLTDAYNFASMTSIGVYTIQYMEPLLYISKDKMMSRKAYELSQTQILQSVTIYLKDTSVLDQPFDGETYETDDELEADDASCEKASYISATEKEGNYTLEMHEFICKSLKLAKLDVDTHPSLYKEWFGARSTKNTDIVKKTIGEMIKGLTVNKVIYDMKPKHCQPKSSGYLHLHKKTLVFSICRAFFSRDMYCSQFGSSSREGIVVNMLSKLFGHTAGIRHGEKGCRFLAKYFPEIAIHNSDNYERFYCQSRFE